MARRTRNAKTTEIVRVGDRVKVPYIRGTLTALVSSGQVKALTPDGQYAQVELIYGRRHRKVLPFAVLLLNRRHGKDVDVPVPAGSRPPGMWLGNAPVPPTKAQLKRVRTLCLIQLGPVRCCPVCAQSDGHASATARF